MTDNENEFTHADGIVYVAVEVKDYDCSKCSFAQINCKTVTSIPCMGYARNDLLTIIWQPKADQ